MTAPTTYKDLLAFLLPPHRPAPLLTPSPSAYSKTVNSRISNLQLHPTLEALLHLLNADLNSAHFLVRHMQAAPKYEGMHLHALLHRIEGDYDNARAWYGDLAAKGEDAECFMHVWKGGKEEEEAFVGRVQELRKGRSKKEGRDEVWESERKALEEISEDEVRRLATWCEHRFGSKAWGDATTEWKEADEKTKNIQSKMTIGGEGWRNF